MNTRIEKVRGELAREGLRLALFTNLSNVFYLSGFRGSDGALLVTPSQAVLLVDGRYGIQAKEQAPDCEVVVYPEKIGGISDAVGAAGIADVGFEARSMSVELLTALEKKSPKVKWKKLGNWVSTFRAVKDEAELNCMKKGNRIADDSARDLIRTVKAGMTEKEVADELEHLMKRRGAEKASFDILTASAARAALPHAKPTDRKIQNGEMFFLDFGCTYEGYQTDQTLTLAIGGVSKKQREIYDIVKEAHDRAMSAVKPGVSTKDLDALARDFITERGHGDAFSHSLGHGIGIDVHEHPTLSWKLDVPLEAGMVVTIEPGIYLPGELGVRIEDAVIVTKNGYEVLTSVDKAFTSL